MRDKSDAIDKEFSYWLKGVLVMSKFKILQKTWFES